jgi:hypothetical protein
MEREREPRLIELKETVFHSSSLLTGVISHSLSLYCILYTCVCIYLTLSLSLSCILSSLLLLSLPLASGKIDSPLLLSCDRLACALLLNYCRADCTFPIFFWTISFTVDTRRQPREREREKEKGTAETEEKQSGVVVD